MIKTLSIIIPVYNEEKTIHDLLNKIKDLKLIHNIKKEIIIINDCSTDHSEKKIQLFIKKNKDLNIISLNHENNMGKGSAVNTGIQKANSEYSIIQDADLELNPQDINKLINAVLQKKADIIYGSRFLKNRKHAKEMMMNRIANIILTKMSNIILNMKLTDMQTCYKLIPTEIFKSISLNEKGFAFDPEITAKLKRYSKLTFAEIPISYEPRTENEGKKIKCTHGFRQVFSILKYGLFK